MRRLILKFTVRTSLLHMTTKWRLIDVDALSGPFVEDAEQHADIGFASVSTVVHDIRNSNPFGPAVRTNPLVGSVQYTCPVVPLCIVDASLSHYVGN